MNILAGGDNADENEDEDGEKPFAIQQKEDRERLVSEIHGALGGDDEEEDDEEDFLVKRKEERDVKPIDLPDPGKNEDEFLQAFLDTKGWLPQTIDKKTGKSIVPSYGDIVEDDDDFEDRAEQYEIKHNFRFEDDNAAEIVSYARNQSTVRRTEESSRKKQREAKIQARLEEEKKKEAKVARIKNKKVKEVTSKFEQLKQALGGDGDDAADEDTLQRLLAASENLDILDFDGDEWDKKMEQVFNDDFYSKGGHKPKLGENDNEEDEKDEDEDDAELEETAGNDEKETSKLSKNQQKREEKRLNNNKSATRHKRLWKRTLTQSLKRRVSLTIRPTTKPPSSGTARCRPTHLALVLATFCWLMIISSTSTWGSKSSLRSVTQKRRRRIIASMPKSGASANGVNPTSITKKNPQTRPLLLHSRAVVDPLRKSKRNHTKSKRKIRVYQINNKNYFLNN